MSEENKRKHVLRCCNDKTQGVSNCPDVQFVDDHVVFSDPDQPGTPTIRLTRAQFETAARLYDEDSWAEE